MKTKTYLMPIKAMPETVEEQQNKVKAFIKELPLLARLRILVYGAAFHFYHII